VDLPLALLRLSACAIAASHTHALKRPLIDALKASKGLSTHLEHVVHVLVHVHVYMHMYMNTWYMDMYMHMRMRMYVDMDMWIGTAS
jgi:hypothetical protein